MDRPSFKERRQIARRGQAKTFSTRSISWLIVSSLVGLGGFLYFSGEEGGNFGLIDDLVAIFWVLGLLLGAAVAMGTFIAILRRNQGSSLVARQRLIREEREGRQNTKTDDNSS